SKSIITDPPSNKISLSPSTSLPADLRQQRTTAFLEARCSSENSEVLLNTIFYYFSKWLQVKLIETEQEVIHIWTWQPPPAFLPGKSHGERSLAGHSPWGHKESDTTEQQHAQWYTHDCRGSARNITSH
ncbi:hypothetical protein FD755_002839, partial [Muntiacus reevesi]